MNNSILRSSIIEHLNPDILCISETHLADNTLRQPEVPNFMFIGHCRKLRHVRSNRSYGGVGMLIKSYMYNCFDIAVILNDADGILSVLFTDKNTNLKFVVFAVYLPPEDSPWGKNADDFYAYLLSQLYLLSHIDHVFICGDVNARVGNCADYIVDVDNVIQRKAIDLDKNKHGETLIEFLIESKMVILNGRVTPNLDNYTSVSSKGVAVVDYLLATQNSIDICSKCEVRLISDVIEQYDLSHLLGEHCKMPDHSLVLGSFDLNPGSEFDSLTTSESLNVTIKPKRYSFRSIPNNFMNTQLFKDSLSVISSEFENANDVQSQINSVYNKFTEAIIKEMDKYLHSTSHKNNSNKHFKNFKPFWNNQLSVCWRDMKEAQKKFLRCRNDRYARQICRLEFQKKRKNFDKLLRQTERTYYNNLADELHNVNTKNPTQFWKHINNLGPKKKKNIPMKVKLPNGDESYDIKYVHEHWKNEFCNLLNKNDNHVNETQHDKLTELKRLENDMSLPHFHSNVDLNNQINQQEVLRVIQHLKNNKSCGPDFIPNEVLKHHSVLPFIVKLCQFCFNNQVVPQMWANAIISPVLKSASKDPCQPLNYRGISLLCCASKIYSSVLNNRLTKHADTNNQLVEEQNGFRKGRSCLDHVFVLTSIITNKINCNRNIFAAFIDFQKAFDWVNRNLLLYKLISKFNVNGNMYFAIKALLNTSKSCIKINDTFTDYFDITSGVRQGDSISATLFAFFINDLAQEIKNLNHGVNIDDYKVSILLYADDIVFLSESETGLQLMLDHLSNWCDTWELEINKEKSNIIHFRKPSCPQTDFVFKFKAIALNIVNEYRYLGLYVNEFMNFDKSITHLAAAGTRALGAIRNKIHNIKNLHFKVYSKLYQTGVTPILDYCSAIWGYKMQKCIQDVQNRAIRYFLGVHKFCPLAAMEGDMGWSSCLVRSQLNMVLFWNHLVNMSDNRLPKKILLYNIKNSNECNNWFTELKKLITIPRVENLPILNIEQCKNEFTIKQISAWNQNRYQKLKLRYYNLFKPSLETEPYVLSNLTKSQRSMYAQFRSGILPIAIETGRFSNVSLNNRLCVMCNSQQIEDEFHFLCECSKYQNERQKLYNKIITKYPDFMQLDDIDKFMLLNCAQYQYYTAIYIGNAYNLRKTSLYK